MAARKKTPGHEPAFGQGHPVNDAVDFKAISAGITHWPHSNGAVCNAHPVPTDPSAYVNMHDPTAEPTCEACLKWIRAARRNTSAMLARQAAAAAAAKTNE